MKKEEKISIFKKIIKTNIWLTWEISENIWISLMTIWRISTTWKWKIEIKEKILNFLETKNLIEKWKYTITEFFSI